MTNKLFTIELRPNGSGTLWHYISQPNGRALAFAAPSFVVDGKRRVMLPERFAVARGPRRLRNGAIEHVFRGNVEDGLALTLTCRIAKGSPVVRFRYAVESLRPRQIKGGSAADAPEYLRFSLAQVPDVAELRLSEFVNLVHSYCPSEIPLKQKDFDAGLGVMGPIWLPGTKPGRCSWGTSTDRRIRTPTCNSTLRRIAR